MLNPKPEIDKSAVLGVDVRVWAGTQVREEATIGDNTSIGQYCYIGPGVEIGKGCKIQNHALIYEPAVIGDGVFIGPRVVITNDLNPRALNTNGEPKTAQDWHPAAATIKRGASLGAGVICVGPVIVGEWAMVAAGSVVVKNVPNHALVAGVPSRQIGWVGRAGVKLVESGEFFVCPTTGEHYSISGSGSLTLVSG